MSGEGLLLIHAALFCSIVPLQGHGRTLLLSFTAPPPHHHQTITTPCPDKPLLSHKLSLPFLYLIVMSLIVFIWFWFWNN
jgi:hypothetical protein